MINSCGVAETFHARSQSNSSFLPQSPRHDKLRFANRLLPLLTRMRMVHILCRSCGQVPKTSTRGFSPPRRRSAPSMRTLTEAL